MATPTRLLMVLACALAALPASAAAETPRSAEAEAALADDPVLGALAAELDRLQTAFGALDPAPFYIAISVQELTQAGVSGEFGTLQSASEATYRQVYVDLRVGEPGLDNTHPVRGRWSRARRSRGLAPLDDDISALRHAIWMEAESAYRDGVERLGQVRANVGVKAEEEDTTGDFVAAPPVVHIAERLAPGTLDVGLASAQVAEWSAPFAGPSFIFTNIVRQSITSGTRWLVNTEGSVVRDGDRQYRLQLYGEALADDGMQLPAYESWFWRDPADAPAPADVAATAERMVESLTALREAPVAEPTIVPAILSGRAAGVFFHEVLGHRLEGHRQKDEDEGHTFRNRVGTPVMGEGFSVVFDPTLDELDDLNLSGSYAVDDEGIASRRVVAVEDGILRSFLVGRRPVQGFVGSNGHGRAAFGSQAVARQSNLIVLVDEPVTEARLEALLIEELVATGKPYGLVFEDVMGGFTLTGRWMPNSWEVIPTRVFKVYADGRRELVRGVDLIGTPLAALERIVAGSDTRGVFNGFCGAESGWVPVSGSSPSLLLSEIEVQKKPKEQEQAPILPAPPGKEGAS